MPISFVWLYMFKCDVCVLYHMWIKPKWFFFLFFFILELICITHIFKIVFVWKTCFLGVFMTHFTWSTHTTHKFNVQWMPISFVWLYMFKCDVCVLNHMWIKPKRFLFFLFAFGSDLYHLSFSSCFCLKTMFSGCFRDPFYM